MLGVSFDENAEMPQESINAEQVATPSETTDLPDTNASDDGLVTEGLAGMDIGQVDFDDRAFDGCDGVSDGDGRVGICAGVEDDAIRPVAGDVEHIDEFAFVVGLLGA